MSEWLTKSLGEACTIAIGGTPARARPEFWDSERKTNNLWASIADLKQRVVCDTTERITEAGIHNSNAKLVEAGTVLLSFKLTVGRVAVAGRDLYTNEAIAALTSNEVLPAYLYYGLQKWDLLDDVDRAIKGATLNKAKLRRIPIHFPTSRREQSKIAEVLATVDAAIEQTEALIAKYQRIKTGLMHDLLTRGIDEHGRLRDPATHAFKDSPLGKIPVEWEVKALGDLVDDSAYGPRFPATAYSDSGNVEILRTTDLDDEGNIVSPFLPKAQLNLDSFRDHILRAGDLMITRSGTLGIATIYSHRVVPTIPGAFLIRFRLSHNADPRFICLLLNSRIGRQVVLGDAAGGVQQNLKGSSLMRLKFAIPSRRDEQVGIAQILDSVRSHADVTKQQLAKLKRIKTGLMQDLLTGRVSVAPLLTQSTES